MDVSGIVSAITSRLSKTNLFSTVIAAEPQGPSGTGLAAGLSTRSIGPAPRGSGLSSTSLLWVLDVTIVAQAQNTPQTGIELDVLRAVDKVCGLLSGDFDLGNKVRCVDLLGQSGQTLRADFRWYEFGSGLARVAVITVPLIVDDVWTQEV